MKRYVELGEKRKCADDEELILICVLYMIEPNDFTDYYTYAELYCAIVRLYGKFVDVSVYILSTKQD